MRGIVAGEAVEAWGEAGKKMAAITSRPQGEPIRRARQNKSPSPIGVEKLSPAGLGRLHQALDLQLFFDAIPDFWTGLVHGHQQFGLLCDVA